jgi:uncharacterized protein
MTQSKGLRGLLGLAVLGLMLIGGAAMAAPKFPPLTGRVVDNAGLLSPQAEQTLTAQLADLEAKTGRQMVVATLPDLGGYEIEDYGYQLGRAWGIGDKTRNDGVLLLVAPNDRKVRIEVGYGLEGILTDALSSVIIQTKILPAFRSGKMEEGVVAGAQAVIGQLSLPDDQAKAIATATPAPEPESENSLPGVIIFIVLIIFWVLSGILRGGRGRRGRRGSGLWWLLPLLLSGGGGRGGGGGSWGGGGGGFSGGGGSFGGGGSSGGW